MDPVLEANTETLHSQDIFPENALLMRIMLLFLGTLILSLGSIYLLRQPGSSAFIWYANGFCIAIIALSPAAQRFVLGCAAFASIVFANLLFNDPLVQSLQLGFANLLTIALGGASLAMISRKSAPFLTVKGFSFFVLFVALLSPVVGAFVGSLVLEITLGVPFSNVAPAWYLGDVIGLIAIVPLTYTVFQRRNDIPTAFLKPKTLLVMVLVIGVSDWMLIYSPHPFVVIAMLLAMTGALLDRVSAFGTSFLVSLTLDTLLLSPSDNLGFSAMAANQYDHLIPIVGAMLLGGLLAVKSAQLLHLQKLSNERFETFANAMQSSVIGTVVMLKDGHLSQANKSFQSLTGYPPQELDKKVFRQLLFFRDKSVFQEGIQSLESENVDNFQAQVRLTKKNKQVIWTKLGITAVRDIWNKEITQYILQVQNVDNERRLDDERTLWAKKFDFALEMNRTTLYEMECHTKFIQLSDNAEQSIGVKASSIKRLYEWMSRIHPEDLREYQHAVSHIKSTTITLEYRLLDDMNRYRWVRDHCQPIEHDSNSTTSRVIGTVTDIDEEKSGSSLEPANERYTTVVEHICEMGVWEYIPRTGELYWNNKMYDLHEQKNNSVISLDIWKSFVAGKDHTVLDKLFDLAREREKRIDVNIQRTTADDRLISLNLIGQVIHDDKGPRIVGVCRKASSLQHKNMLLNELNAQQSAAIELMSDGVILLDAHFFVNNINASALQLTEEEKDCILGDHIDKHFNIFLRNTQFTFAHLFSAYQKDFTLNGTFILQPRKGIEQKVHLEGSPVFTDNEGPGGWVLTLRSTEKPTTTIPYQLDEESDAKDPLTGMLTRRGFEHALQTHIDTLHQQSSAHCLVHIELRGITALGNALGSSVGDQVIKSTALILKSHLNKIGTLARVEQNQFLALLEGQTLSEGKVHVGAILDKMNTLDFTQRDAFPLDCVAGITAAESTKSTPFQLIYQAQVAKDSVQENQTSPIAVFDKTSMSEGITTIKNNLIQQIDSAIEHRSFSLLSMPLVPCDPNQLTWHEVLIRLITEDGKLLMPSDFLSAAEPTGRLGRIESWVFNEILIEQSESLRANNLHIAVNISTGSFYNEAFIESCLNMIENSVLPASQLCIEIKESTLLIDVLRAKEIVTSFRKLGCRVAIDNFGAELTSFNCLKKFNVNMIKIDGSIAALGKSSRVERRIIESIQQISQSLNVKTAAQKVNSEEDLALMQSLGIDFAQGYFFGEPIPLALLISRAKAKLSSPKATSTNTTQSKR